MLCGNKHVLSYFLQITDDEHTEAMNFIQGKWNKQLKLSSGWIKINICCIIFGLHHPHWISDHVSWYRHRRICNTAWFGEGHSFEILLSADFISKLCYFVSYVWQTKINDWYYLSLMIVIRYSQILLQRGVTRVGSDRAERSGLPHQIEIPAKLMRRRLRFLLRIQRARCYWERKIL